MGSSVWVTLFTGSHTAQCWHKSIVFNPFSTLEKMTICSYKDLLNASNVIRRKCWLVLLSSIRFGFMPGESIGVYFQHTSWSIWPHTQTHTHTHARAHTHQCEWVCLETAETERGGSGNAEAGESRKGGERWKVATSGQYGPHAMGRNACAFVGEWRSKWKEEEAEERSEEGRDLGRGCSVALCLNERASLSDSLLLSVCTAHVCCSKWAHVRSKHSETLQVTPSGT